MVTRSGETRAVPSWRLNDAGRLLIRWGRRSHGPLAGSDIERGATAVRRDPRYREEVYADALRYADSRPDLRRRVIEAGGLLDDQPLPHGRRCGYTFPLPSWAGEDQMDPCRCDLHHVPRRSPRVRAHPRATVRLRQGWKWCRGSVQRNARGRGPVMVNEVAITFLAAAGYCGLAWWILGWRRWEK